MLVILDYQLIKVFTDKGDVFKVRSPAFRVAVSDLFASKTMAIVLTAATRWRLVIIVSVQKVVRIAYIR